MDEFALCEKEGVDKEIVKTSLGCDNMYDQSMGQSSSLPLSQKSQHTNNFLLVCKMLLSNQSAMDWRRGSSSWNKW